MYRVGLEGDGGDEVLGGGIPAQRQRRGPEPGELGQEHGRRHGGHEAGEQGNGGGGSIKVRSSTSQQNKQGRRSGRTRVYMSWRIGVRAFVVRGGRRRDREVAIGREMRFRIARRMAASARRPGALHSLFPLEMCGLFSHAPPVTRFDFRA